jgi:hypothetical protein
MHNKALKRKLTAWIAMFAILLASLAPSISHAISAAKGELWMEICTVEGVKFIKFGGGSPETPPVKKTTGLEHCPFCSTHGGAVGVLPSSEFAIPKLDAPATMPSLFYQSPRPLAIWASAQSRAPPFTL